MDLCVEHGGTSEKWDCSVCFPKQDAMEEFGPQPKLPLKDAERKALPIFTFLTQYFPDVIVELTKLCVAGNIQHNPELPPADIKWAREKSTDQLNTAFRHAFDRGTGTHYDADGQPHLIKAIWRYMAQRQLDIEAERKAGTIGELLPDKVDLRCNYVFAGRWRCTKILGHEGGHYAPCS